VRVLRTALALLRERASAVGEEFDIEGGAALGGLTVCVCVVRRGLYAIGALGGGGGVGGEKEERRRREEGGVDREKDKG
jgi:hypothetical protein